MYTDQNGTTTAPECRNRTAIHGTEGKSRMDGMLRHRTDRTFGMECNGRGPPPCAWGPKPRLGDPKPRLWDPQASRVKDPQASPQALRVQWLME